MGTDEPREPHPLATPFEWTRIGRPQLRPGQIADRGERSLRRLREWGCHVPAGNRLERAVALVLDTAKDEARLQSAGEELLERIGEAGQAILDLYMATHGDADRPTGVVLKKFTQALGGHDLPRTERDHFARNIQFELYMWGLMRAARIPVWFEEPPDLMLSYGNETVGIAVKRIWSLNQAKKKLSKGAKQVEQSARRGFIATNAQEYITVGSLVGELKDKGASFNADVRRLHGHIAYLETKPSVLGLIVSGTKFGWHREGNPRRIEMASYNQVFVFPHDEKEGHFARSFFERQGDNLRVWMQENL